MLVQSWLAWPLALALFEQSVIGVIKNMISIAINIRKYPIASPELDLKQNGRTPTRKGRRQSIVAIGDAPQVDCPAETRRADSEDKHARKGTFNRDFMR
jgi:hypothetical protein